MTFLIFLYDLVHKKRVHLPDWTVKPVSGYTTLTLGKLASVTQGLF